MRRLRSDNDNDLDTVLKRENIDSDMSARTDITWKKLTRYVGALRKGLRHGEACRAADLHRDTVWEYKKKYPEFKEQCDCAEADFCDTVEKHLLEAISEKKNMTGIIFWLTNRGNGRWKDMRNVGAVETQGDNNEALKAILARLEGKE